jgi:type VI secretion system secreted protein VgrG
MEKKLKVDINIEGTQITHFSTFNLDQRFNEHHTFQLRFNHDMVEEYNSITLENSKDFIGKNITVQFGTDDSGENVFSGIVTKIELSQSNGFHSDILVSGFSPGILIDRGPDLGSYLNKNLSSIIQLATQDAPQNDLKFNIKPTNTSPIDYIIQYRESDYEFINRLSAEYHEWFYYDGVKLNFGKPDKLEEVDLIYGRDLHSLQYAMQIAPLKHNKFAYNPKQDEMLFSEPQGSSGGTPDASHAISASNKVFSKVYNEPLAVRVNTKKEIDDFVNNQQKALISDLVTIVGSGDNPIVGLGKKLNVRMSMRGATSFEIQDFGKFLVTAVYHQIDGVGHYQNTFEGVTADTERLTVQQAEKPNPDMQLATVIDNDDPQKQGRIKVKFKWQCTSNDDTEWLRVVTPSAGNYSAGSNNRGLIAIPEVNDQVLVGFEEGNIARPVIMGSVYHNNNGDSTQQISNNIKSMSTRSGVLIQFNDTDSQGSITISDPSGNNWYMDGNGNITVSAPGNITINAGENITMNAGQNIIKNAGENIDAIAALNINHSAGENMSHYAGALMTHTAVSDYSLAASNIKKVATGNIAVEGGSVSKQASGDVRITSTNGNINKHAQEEVQNNSGQNTKHN